MIPIGLTVTKAFPPTNPPAAKIIKPGKDMGGGKMLASSIGKTADYAKTLQNTKKNQGFNDKIPELEPPKLTNIERKLQILNGEWYVESMYCQDDVAALYAYYQPTQGPFIIIPSAVSNTLKSDFTLTIFSSRPVEVQKLEDSRNLVQSGKWDKKNAGGCHLFDKEFEQKSDKCNWSLNPKYQLRLQTTQPTRVKITLSRPEKAWKAQIGKSLVGCMIGFYVYPGNLQPSKDVLINKDSQKFVPWNEVHEELTLDGNPDGYILMPTTYEPLKFGEFIVSVAADVDFTLTPLE